jgi:hypothetical protein
MKELKIFDKVYFEICLFHLNGDTKIPQSLYFSEGNKEVKMDKWYMVGTISEVNHNQITVYYPDLRTGKSDVKALNRNSLIENPDPEKVIDWYKFKKLYKK